MDSNEIFQKLKKVFDQQDINYELLNNLKRKTVHLNKNTLKVHLLYFLMDKNDKTATIKNPKDLWFIKENPDNLNLIIQYVNFMINLINKDDYTNMNIYKEMEEFVITDIGYRLIYILSILNNCYVSDWINFLFLGFLIGECKDFIRKNYIENLQDLLILINSHITLNSNMSICSLKENILEVLNIYVFFKSPLFKDKSDENSIKSMENYLINSEYGLNTYSLYEKIMKENALNFLFIDEGTSNIYKARIKAIYQKIENKVKELQIIEKLRLEASEKQLSNEETERIEETEDIEEIDDSNEEEKENKLIMLSNSKNTFLKILSNDNNNNPINNIIKKQNEPSNKQKEDIKDTINNTQIDTDIHENIYKEPEDIKDKVINPKNSDNSINITEQNKDNNNENIIKSKNINGNLERINNCELENNKMKINNINIENQVREKSSDINNETKKEKKNVSDNSLNCQKNHPDLKIFEDFNKWINFPDKKEFNIIENVPNERKEITFILRVISNLNELTEIISILKNVLNKSLNDVTLKIEQIKNNSRFKVLSMKNIRLEILVNLLKNPNIINIKRKIIEILIFRLFSENSPYFNLNKEYYPSNQNLNELKKLMENKLENVVNEQEKNEIQNDIEKIDKELLQYDQKNNNDDVNIKKCIEIDIGKKDDLFVLFNFLEFFISNLHPEVHLSENKSKLYLLPRSLFKSEIEVFNYLYDLESLISDKDDKENDNIEIGFPPKKGKKQKVDLNIDLYKESKFISLNEAINILFSFDSKVDYFQNYSFNKIENYQIEFQKDINKIYDDFIQFFKIDFDYNNPSLNFSDEINNQIINYAENFEKNVLQKLSDVIDLLFNGKFDDNRQIINEIKSFFKLYIENSRINLDDDNALSNFKNNSHLLYFIKVKILIMQKIIKFFENNNQKFVSLLKEKDTKYNELNNTIKANLIELRNLVKIKYRTESVNEIYAKWQNKNKNRYSIKKLKECFQDYIKKPLNLEMNYTYDSKFCLWAIKKGFGKYFE